MFLAIFRIVLFKFLMPYKSDFLKSVNAYLHLNQCTSGVNHFNCSLFFLFQRWMFLNSYFPLVNQDVYANSNLDCILWKKSTNLRNKFI